MCTATFGMRYFIFDVDLFQNFEEFFAQNLNSASEKVKQDNKNKVNLWFNKNAFQ